MSNQDKKLIIWLFWAIVAFNILYHCWLYVVGGLAIFGAAYMIKEYNRNNHNR
jgi:hypothetical protein